MSRELGGFLLGGFYKHEQEYVEISAFLPAQDTHNARATLTFTHQTWAKLNDDVDSLISGIESGRLATYTSWIWSVSFAIRPIYSSTFFCSTMADCDGS